MSLLHSQVWHDSETRSQQTNPTGAELISISLLLASAHGYDDSVFVRMVGYTRSWIMFSLSIVLRGISGICVSVICVSIATIIFTTGTKSYSIAKLIVSLYHVDPPQFCVWAIMCWSVRYQAQKCLKHCIPKVQYCFLYEHKLARYMRCMLTLYHSQLCNYDIKLYLE